MLEVKELIYCYKDGTHENRYDFSLLCKKSEIAGIIGASGNGKSTLLDLISGFLQPISGKITFGSQDITNLPPQKRPITILFQNHNLFEHLSVEKNILLGLGNTKEKNSSQKIDKILNEVGLKGYNKKIASKLSGGEQQRVSLARALLRDKSILLLDEPFSGLDFKTRTTMLSLVQKITKSKNICTIMVTHELNDCKEIANRVYEVKNGKLTLL